MSCTGTTSSPNRATNHCTGRRNSCCVRPQRMRLLTGIPATAVSMTSGSTAVAVAPASTLRSPSRSPFGVAMASRVSTSTPCFLAKPRAAGDQLPSASLDAATGGPRASTVRSGACTASPVISTAKRRGVANSCEVSNSRSWEARPSDKPCCKASAITISDPAGSSSVPNSNNRSVLAMVTLGPPGLAVSNRDRPGESPVQPWNRSTPWRRLSPGCVPEGYSAGAQ